MTQLYNDPAMNQVHNEKWDKETLQSAHCREDKKKRVQKMFSEIAGRYDLLNHTLSANQDHRWRRFGVKCAELKDGMSVVDICCGTGDMAFEFAKAAPNLKKVTGVDFVKNMLTIAQKKGDRFQKKHGKQIELSWICSDAENITMLPDEAFDRASCVFGMRNLQILNSGLSEMYRLLKPGGRGIIIEFDLPRNKILNWGYQLYFRYILPLIGKIISQDKTGAYKYLPESVCQFDARKLIPEGLKAAGFHTVKIKELNFGSVLIFIAEK